MTSYVMLYVVKYTSICIAHFYAKRLKCAQTWITQFYLQITPCLPLLPCRRTSPPFGWYSFYRPTEGRRLSRPGWLVTYRNKVPAPSQTVATVRIAPKICHGQPPTMYVQCSIFHPNRCTFDGVIADCVNTVFCP